MTTTEDSYFISFGSKGYNYTLEPEDIKFYISLKSANMTLKSSVLVLLVIINISLAHVSNKEFISSKVNTHTLHSVKYGFMS